MSPVLKIKVCGKRKYLKQIFKFYTDIKTVRNLRARPL